MSGPGTQLKLIVGLGNPGAEYALTRHNAGWWFVDALAARAGASWRSESRRHGDLARARIGDTELWLLKPTDYMNRSGAAVASVAGFYRLPPEQILVVHDDIDLLPGIARLKHSGGHGGHNGVRDVIAHIGADFWRLRLGVGHPGARDLVIDAVLDRPTASEQRDIDDSMQRALDAVSRMLTEGAQKAMHRLHSTNVRSGAPGSTEED
jgi:PTH1 family peptidyl-tRNA hydrolase